MEQPTRFIGMDVHKDTIVVAVTTAGDSGKATPYGTFPNSAAALEKLVERLRQAGSGSLKFCYEAGPCGYGVHRTLTRLGYGIRTFDSAPRAVAIENPAVMVANCAHPALIVLGPGGL